MDLPRVHYSLIIFSTRVIHIFMVKKKKERKKGREAEENKTFKSSMMQKLLHFHHPEMAKVNTFVSLLSRALSTRMWS